MTCRRLWGCGRGKSRCRRLRFARKRRNGPEEELAVEVGHVDGVHVDDVDVGKAHEREVLEDFASQTASAFGRGNEEGRMTDQLQ